MSIPVGFRQLRKVSRLIRRGLSSSVQEPLPEVSPPPAINLDLESGTDMKHIIKSPFPYMTIPESDFAGYFGDTFDKYATFTAVVSSGTPIAHFNNRNNYYEFRFIQFCVNRYMFIFSK